MTNEASKLSAELRIPEGIIVRTARGGPEVLKGILSDLKQYSFSGYIKVILKKENLSSTGFLVIEQGAPSMSIYQFEKTQPREMRRIYAGDKSMRFVWEDSQDKQSLIELHSRVPKEEFDRRFPDAKLQDIEAVQVMMAKPRPSTRPVVKPSPEVHAAEEHAAPEEDPILAEIKRMRHDGYIVDKLEEMFKVNRTGAKKELAKYQERIGELKKLEKLLDNIPHVGFDNEIEGLRERLNDPSQLESINGDIEMLRERTKKQIEQTKMAEREIEEDIKDKKREEKVSDLYELILQYQRGQIPVKETPVCEKCGSVLDGRGVCPKCSEAGKEEKISEIPEEFSFDSFVVGAGSKFAFAAAIAVAQAPDKAYNPLFLYGKSGLGKTHLLNAIAKKLLADDPKSSIALISAEKFAEDLERAMKDDDVHGFRDRLRNKKALLIDDFQFLAGKEMAQGELLYLLDETKKSGGQIVIASDRLPKEIPRLSEPLSAKIQGGLIADIQAPDEETRIEILKRKAKEKGKEVPEPVLKFIAEKVQNNVRELEAALNRLIAFSTVMKLNIDIQLAREVLMPTLGAQAEREMAAGPEVDVKPGHSYLIEEERPVGSNKLFAKKIQEGYRGLEITRMNPKQVRQEFGVKGNILWLTDKESRAEKTVPPSLEMIVHTIEEFMVPGEKEILLIDGLQYLISNTSFEGVLRFLRRLIDDFSESNSMMMISVSRGTLSTQELSILERELETIKLD